MTEKQMLSTLKELTFGTVVGSKGVEALEMAIQALSQDPCDDAISRQAVLDIVDSYSESRSNVEDVTQDMISDILALPPVTQNPKYWIDKDNKIYKMPDDIPIMTIKYPTITHGDTISRTEVMNVISDFVALEKYIDKHNHITFEPLEQMINSLPSVTQKSGKWIKVKSGDKYFPESIVCSRCGNENSHLDFNENAEPIGKVFITSKYCPSCGSRMTGGLSKNSQQKLCLKQDLNKERQTGECKNCKYFEYDSWAKVDGVPLIVAHEICNKWGDGCKTKEDGYCYLFEPRESEV